MFSEDVRKICLNLLRKSGSLRKAAELCDMVSKSTIAKWTKTTQRKFRSPTKTTPEMVDFVKNLLVEKPFLNASQVAETITAEKGMSISTSAVRTCIRKAGLSFKKCRYVVSKVGLDDDRERFARHVLESINPDDVLSVDETSIEYLPEPVYGFAPRGERLACTAATHVRKRWTLVAAASTSGIETSLMIDGGITSQAFCVFAQMLRGTSKKYIMMDNVSSHTTKDAVAACRAAGLANVHPSFPTNRTLFLVAQEENGNRTDTWNGQA